MEENPVRAIAKERFMQGYLKTVQEKHGKFFIKICILDSDNTVREVSAQEWAGSTPRIRSWMEAAKRWECIRNDLPEGDRKRLGRGKIRESRVGRIIVHTDFSSILHGYEKDPPPYPFSTFLFHHGKEPQYWPDLGELITHRRGFRQAYTYADALKNHAELLNDVRATISALKKRGANDRSRVHR